MTLQVISFHNFSPWLHLWKVIKFIQAIQQQCLNPTQS